MAEDKNSDQKGNKTDDNQGDLGNGNRNGQDEPNNQMIVEIQQMLNDLIISDDIPDLPEMEENILKKIIPRHRVISQ